MTNPLVPLHSKKRFFPTYGNGFAFFDSARCSFVDARLFLYIFPPMNAYYDLMVNDEPFMDAKRAWEGFLDDIMRVTAAMHNVPYDFMVRPPSKGNRKETI